MKKIIALLVVVVMVFGVVVSAVAGLWASRTDNDDIIYVNWPISMITEDPENFNETVFLAQNDGYNSVTINDNGTVTIGLDPRLHKMIQEQMYSHLNTIFQSLIDSDDTPFIKEISYDNSLREMVVLVDENLYLELGEESYQNIEVLALYIIEYHTILGYDIGSEIIIADYESGEEIDTINIPNDLDL